MNIDILLEDVPMSVLPQMREILEIQNTWNTLFGEKPHFNATVLAMVKEIFNPKKFFLWDLIKIAPIGQVSQVIFHNKQEIKIKTRTKAFLTNYCYKYAGIPDTFDAAERIREEVIMQIMGDLYSIAYKHQNHYTWDLLSGNALVEFVAEMRERYPNLKWIILNPLILESAQTAVINGIRIYTSNFLSEFRALISTTNSMDSTYIFSPLHFEFEETNDNINPPGLVKMRYGNYAHATNPYEIIEII
jgi:hypothetical protein